MTSLGPTSDFDLIYLDRGSNMFFRSTQMDSDVQLGVQVTHRDDKTLFLHSHQDSGNMWLYPGLRSSRREGPVLPPQQRCGNKAPLVEPVQPRIYGLSIEGQLQG